MSTTLAELAPSLQSLLGEEADRLARQCGFVKRQRVFCGSSFLQTCLLTWLEHKDATLEQFVATAASLGVSVSVQGFDRRLDDAADFFRSVLRQALQQAIDPAPRALPLLDRFAGVYLDDCSTVSLPAQLAEQFQGCRGCLSGAKLLLRWEVRSARLEALQLHPARAADTELAELLPGLANGSLRIFDLGFFKIAALRRCQQAGAFFLCKLKQPAALRIEGRRVESLARWLGAQSGRRVDCDARVGGGSRGRVDCRLVAWRLSEEQAAKRREKALRDGAEKGHRVSEEALALCSWLVMLTNVPRGVLSGAQVSEVYRVRWQIELIFKSWKSDLEVDEWRSDKPGRVLAEVYGKLLVALVQSWLTLQVWAEGPAKSLRRLLKGMAAVLGKALWRLARAGAAALVEEMELARPGLLRLGRLHRRRKRPGTFQRLEALALHPDGDDPPAPADNRAA